MKKIILAICILFSFAAKSQRLQYVNTYGYEYQRLGSDSLFFLPKDTFAVPSYYQSFGFMARKAGVIYLWNTTTHIWEALAGSDGGTTYTFPYSVVAPGNAIQLENDTIPFANGYYGFNAAGRRTWMAKNITGLITAGSNITLSGSGTIASPYSISSSGGSTPTGVVNYDWRNVLDQTTNNRDLTIGGKRKPDIAANIFGSGINGLRYNATQLVGNPEPFVLPSSFTWEVRIKRTTQAAEQAIIALWRTADSVKNFRLYIGADDSLRFQGYNGYVVSTVKITDSTAHAIAVVKNGDSTSLYLDGTRVAANKRIIYDTADSYIPFTIGNSADYSNSSGGTPFAGVIGDVRYSSVARYTGASYTVSSSAAVIDTSTIALYTSTLTGTYIDSTAFQSNIITRSGFAPGSGGLANPDGFFRTNDGKYAISFSAYDGSEWTVWIATATTLAGPWTKNGTVLQDPAAIEGDLAGNGTVWNWKGKWFHWYHTSGTAAIGIRASQSDNLYVQFPEGTTVLNPLDYGYGAFVDPYVRPSDDGKYLEMWFIGTDGAGRQMLYSTSTDGLSWAAPIKLILSAAPGFTLNPGEPAVIKIGETWLMAADGNKSGSGRQVSRWMSKDKLHWVPAGLFYEASGSPYISTFDASFYLDTANNRLILLSANSENTAPTQPTNSDIGMWYAPITGLDTSVNTWDSYLSGYGGINEIGYFNDNKNIVSDANFKILTAQKQLALGTQGSLFSTVTTPYSINFGSEIGSTTNGGAKAKWFKAGSDSIYTGIGSDGGWHTTSTNGATGFRFRAGTVNRLDISGNYTTSYNVLGFSLPPISGTTPQIIDWGFSYGGPNLRFFSGYEMGLYSSELRTTVGGGAKISFYTGSTEHINFTSGQLNMLTAGSKLNIATGSNASIGVSGAMTAGTITISTTAVTSSSKIFLTHASVAGTQGFLSVGTITAGTSFVINSSSATDTGTVNWWIIN